MKFINFKKRMMIGAAILLTSAGLLHAKPDSKAGEMNINSIQQAKITVTGTIVDKEGPIIGAQHYRERNHQWCYNRL